MWSQVEDRPCSGPPAGRWRSGDRARPPAAARAVEGEAADQCRGRAGRRGRPRRTAGRAGRRARSRSAYDRPGQQVEHLVEGGWRGAVWTNDRNPAGFADADRPGVAARPVSPTVSRIDPYLDPGSRSRWAARVTEADVAVAQVAALPGCAVEADRPEMLSSAGIYCDVRRRGAGRQRVRPRRTGVGPQVVTPGYRRSRPGRCPIAGAECVCNRSAPGVTSLPVMSVTVCAVQSGRDRPPRSFFARRRRPVCHRPDDRGQQESTHVPSAGAPRSVVPGCV